MQRPVETARGEHDGAAAQLRRLSPSSRLDPGAVERFDRAARALAAVRSTDLAAVLHAGPGGCARVFVSGIPLRALVAQAADRPLPLPVTVAVISAVARAGATLHRAGIAHDALTPENVILSREGRVVVTDAGLSAPALGLAPAPSWAAPERVAGGPPSPAADVFALGRLLQLLLGEERQAGPDALLRLVRLALEPAPSRRPASLEGLGEALLSAARASGEPLFVPDLAAFVIASGERDGGEAELLRTARPVSPLGARGAAPGSTSPQVKGPPVEAPLELASVPPPRAPAPVASAGYLGEPGPARRRLALRPLVLGVVLLGLAAGAVVLARRPEVVALIRSPGTAGAIESLVLVDSVPPGADVFLDGELAGQTPLGVGRQAIPGVPLEVRVEKAGYRPEVREATMAERVEVKVRLTPR